MRKSCEMGGPKAVNQKSKSKKRGRIGDVKRGYAYATKLGRKKEGKF